MITSNLLLSENAGQSYEKFVKCKCKQTEHLCAWPEDATRFQYVLKAGFWSDLWTCVPTCSHKCSLQPQLGPLCCSPVLLWHSGQLYCLLPAGVPTFSQFLIRQEASRTKELHSRFVHIFRNILVPSGQMQPLGSCSNPPASSGPYLTS